MDASLAFRVDDEGRPTEDSLLNDAVLLRDLLADVRTSLVAAEMLCDARAFELQQLGAISSVAARDAMRKKLTPHWRFVLMTKGARPTTVCSMTLCFYVICWQKSAHRL